MLKVDLHVHTHFSPDGSTKPATVLKRAARLGLDGVSLTDHNVFDPSLVEELRERTDLLVIPGSEISSTRGHILGYFLKEPVEPWRPPEDIVDDIQSQGGLAVLAHPFRLRTNYSLEDFERYDLIECFNGRSGDPTRSGTPNHHTRRVLSDLDIPVTGGSDSHLYWTVGTGYTLVDANKDLEAVRNALGTGQTDAEGTPSLQINRALSEWVRLYKNPTWKKILKILPKNIRWIARDIADTIRQLRDWLI